MLDAQVRSSLRGGLVVSCQALPGEPMYSEAGGVMAMFARAAQASGAVAIRTSSVRDVTEVMAAVDLPVIGLIKRPYDGYEPFITPTLTEVDELVATGCDVVALDCTDRVHPGDVTTSQLVAAVRERHPSLALMADIATYEEGVAAAALGVDLVGTTLSGYTAQSQGRPAPDVELVRRLAEHVDVPVVAEGHVHTPELARTMLDAGAHCVVVGGAITRPAEITQRFVRALA